MMGVGHPPAAFRGALRVGGGGGDGVGEGDILGGFAVGGGAIGGGGNRV